MGKPWVPESSRGTHSRPVAGVSPKDIKRSLYLSIFFSGFGSNHPVMMKMGILSGIFPIR